MLVKTKQGVVEVPGCDEDRSMIICCAEHLKAGVVVEVLADYSVRIYCALCHQLVLELLLEKPTVN